MSKSNSKKRARTGSRRVSKAKIRNSASSNAKKRLWKHQGR